MQKGSPTYDEIVTSQPVLRSYVGDTAAGNEGRFGIAEGTSGLRRVETGFPVTLDTTFSIASTTKLLAADVATTVRMTRLRVSRHRFSTWQWS